MTEEWRKQAACRGTDPAVFFPDGATWRAVRPAKIMCFTCPVAAECGEANADEPFGIFGGTDDADRVDIRQSRKTIESVWAETRDRLEAEGVRWTKEDVLRMTDKGVGVTEISERLGASHSTIWSIVNRAQRVA
jgi:WhiB family redox-sensing transcriptional regulator